MVKRGARGVGSSRGCLLKMGESSLWVTMPFIKARMRLLISVNHFSCPHSVMVTHIQFLLDVKQRDRRLMGCRMLMKFKKQYASSLKLILKLRGLLVEHTKPQLLAVATLMHIGSMKLSATDLSYSTQSIITLSGLTLKR
ncbi:unannotated protein [freshwater metagenome]|uniref:Unannotated protein n=1 Tax=freshwater metagenome TaxID=449393 RepID=A0A6J6BEB2_9ZZZZ